MTEPRGNRPAEKLRSMIESGRGWPNEYLDLLDAALRVERLAERLAVVEEIKERLAAEGPVHLQQALRNQNNGPEWDDCFWRADIASIIEEVGVAARSAQSDSAGLTEERT